MKRPLVVALIFLIAGILTEFYHNAMIIVFVLTAVVALYLYYRWKPVFIFLLFYTAGVFVVVSRTGIDPVLQEFVGNEITISGVVTDEAKTSGGYRLTVKTDYGIKIMVQTMNERPLGVGGRVEFDGVLENLEGRKNPGGFDERLSMLTRGVHYKTFCRHLTPVELGGFTIYALRNKISAVYDDLLPVKEAGIIKAMIIGDKVGLGEDIKALYRVAGIYHILAISGLHISVLAMFINAMLSMFLSRRISGGATIAFLAFYCVFTGFSLSAVRAAIMCGIIISGDILYREKDALTSTAFAAVLLLLYQPLYLWDVGFLYSFAAVTGIILLSDPIKLAITSVRIKIPAIITETFSATLAATLCTTPIAAYYFYYAMPYGMIVNLLVVPTAALVVVLGFLTGIIGIFIKPLAVMLSGSLYTIFKIYEWVCILFSELPGAAILTGSWPIILVTGWYLLILVVVFKQARFLPVGIAAYAALAFIMSLPGSIEIYNLNVDKGECVVFMDGAEIFVFDGGCNNPYVLSNFLEYKGVGSVAGYFVLHDSLNRADAIADQLNTRAIFASPALSDLKYYSDGGNIYFEEIVPGSVLKKGELEFHITERGSGLGVKVRAGEREFEVGK